MHTGRHVLQADLDLHGAALRGNGRGDLAHEAARLDLGIVEQADDHPSIARRRHQQGFVDIEHRVAIAVPSQAEDRHGRLHHLADLGLALGDHAIGFGHQSGVAQLLVGAGQLRLGGLERALITAQGRFGGIVFAAAGVALGQQFLLAHEGGTGLGNPCLCGEHFGLGRIDVVLQVLGVQARQHLVGLDVVTDVDTAGDDLATNTERQVGLHTRLNIASQGHPGREVGRLYLLHAYPRQNLGGFLLATASEHQQQPQAHDRQRTIERHAGSLLAHK